MRVRMGGGGAKQAFLFSCFFVLKSRGGKNKGNNINKWGILDQVRGGKFFFESFNGKGIGGISRPLVWEGKVQGVVTGQRLWGIRLGVLGWWWVLSGCVWGFWVWGFGFGWFGVSRFRGWVWFQGLVLDVVVGMIHVRHLVSVVTGTWLSSSRLNRRSCYARTRRDPPRRVCDAREEPRGSRDLSPACDGRPRSRTRGRPLHRRTCSS